MNFSMKHRTARPRGVLYRAILPSLLLLWCTTFGLMPALAAPEAAPGAGSSCGCCSPAPGTTDHDSSVLCSALPQAIVVDVSLPPGPATIPAARHSGLLEWNQSAAPLPATSPLFKGPPLYLALLRLRN
jgi:hypothetical protein